MYWEYIAIVPLIWGFITSFKSLLRILAMMTKSIHGIEEYLYDKASKTKSKNLARKISEISKWQMMKSDVEDIGYITLGLHISLNPLFVAYIYENFNDRYRENTFTVYLYCSHKVHDYLDIDNNDENAISYKEYMKISGYHGTFIVKHFVENLVLEPTIKQKIIIEQILNYYKNPELKDLKNRNVCVAYLHGPPGTGKSMIGRFIAQELNGTYASINPTEKNDTSIKYLYYCFVRKTFKDVIICLDDYDKVLLELIKKNNNNTNDPNNNGDYFSEVHDLASHNNLFDMIRTMNKIIVIVTANKSPEDVSDSLKDIDIGSSSSMGSLFRKGRVDLVIPFDEDDIINK